MPRAFEIALQRTQEFRESRNPIHQIRRSLRSDRLNRDNPGERSEHTSPVSRIITLFRPKPRYRSPARSLFRAIPLRSLFSFQFDPSYFPSVEIHRSESFFLTSETISRCRVDRSDFPLDRLARKPLKIFPTLRSFLRLVALTEHFILRTLPRLSLVF